MTPLLAITGYRWENAALLLENLHDGAHSIKVRLGRALEAEFVPLVFGQRVANVIPYDTPVAHGESEGAENFVDAGPGENAHGVGKCAFPYVGI